MDQLFGRPGERLIGAESRALRASLCLDRAMVAGLANALGAWPGGASVQAIVSAERADFAGYPLATSDALHVLEAAVDNWATEIVENAEKHAQDGVATIRRPRGEKRVVALLHLPEYGLELTAAQLAAIDAIQGAFWHCLADAAITRAAITLKAHEDVTVAVIIDPMAEAVGIGSDGNTGLRRRRAT